MSKVPLNDLQLSSISPGEVVTIAAVLAVLAIAIVAVVVYRLFMSEDGVVKLPGGYTFEWK